ncbi:MAG: type II toxin-antitoxin system VapC family toxin [Euryarchaeota archaeon]|nr:type II toxin-antitoxin system VapC family toxin [Euryarchaeota archaeon]
MEYYFLDTSALVKIYHRESGTDAILNIIDKTNINIYISDIAVIEFHSALLKKVRQHEITRNACDIALQKFLQDCEAGDYTIEGFGEHTKEESVSVLNAYSIDYGLRTLDSIQLATALHLHDRDMLTYFVTSDLILERVAKAIGLKTIQP